MPTTRYCDPQLSTGSDNGTSEANAWQSFQTALDSAVADDIVLCRAQDGSTTDEEPSASFDADVAGGSATGGYIAFHGVNSSWVDDGTRLVLDGTSVTTNTAILIFDQSTDRNFFQFKNITFRNAPGAAGDGVRVGTQNGYMQWINCLFQDNGAAGLDNYRAFWTRCYRCVFDSNGGTGWSSAGYSGTSISEFCSFLDNTQRGLQVSTVDECAVINGCIFDNNATDGAEIGAQAAYIYNSIFTRNTNAGIYLHSAADHVQIRGCRIAFNSTYGIESAAVNVGIQEDHNVFYNNTSSHRLNVVTGADSHVAADETELGFADHTSATWNRDFNLTTDAILRSTGITIPIT